MKLSLWLEMSLLSAGALLWGDVRRGVVLVEAFSVSFSTRATTATSSTTTTTRRAAAKQRLGFQSNQQRRFYTSPLSSSTTIHSSNSNSNNNNSNTPAAATTTTTTSFDDGQRPYQITTPIYYVNDKPHIGHAYTSTACDVLARFMRLSGRQVFFLTGTDEHGQKVEQSAAKLSLPPQEFVNAVSQNFKDMLEMLHISQDRFIRTTETAHKEAVQVSIYYLFL